MMHENDSVLDPSQDPLSRSLDESQISDAMSITRTLKQSTSIASSKNQTLKAYICTYNIVLGVSWAYVFLCILLKFVRELAIVFAKYGSTATKSESYHTSLMLRELFLGIFYNLFYELKPVIVTAEVILLLDTVHGFLGFWGEDVVAPLLKRWYCKVGRRAHLLLFALLITPQHMIQHSSLLGFTIFTWALTDVVRYPYYALNMYRKSPYWLTWLRYTNFIIQFPLNVIAENLYIFFILIPACASPNAVLQLPLAKTWTIHYGYIYLLAKLYDNYNFPDSFGRLWRQMMRRLYPKPEHLALQLVGKRVEMDSSPSWSKSKTQ